MAGSPQIANVRLPGARPMRAGDPSDCMPIDPARPGFAASRARHEVASVTAGSRPLATFFDKGH